MMVLKPGSLFASHYEVVRVISAGGMGIVYEVIHRDTKRRRALKVMLPHVVTDPEMRERFALEAVVTAEIESEHLVEIFDAGIDPESDSPFIVMELLRGEDLGSRLQRGERCSPSELVTLFEQAALALEKTHAARIVHRDLKPENLFLTRRDDGSLRLKILDFGIAKIIRSSTDPKSTTKTFGTPYYMAREQVTGEALLIGPSSDTYALAHIAYALLVGRPYFEDEAEGGRGNMLTLLMAVGKGPAESASARASRRGIALPQGFDAWFARATRPDPKRRFASAREMTEELGHVLRGLPPHPLPCLLEPPPTTGEGQPVEPRAIGGTIPLPSSSSPPGPIVPQLDEPATGAPAASSRSGPTTAPSVASQTASPTFSTTSSARLERRPRRGVVAGAIVVGALATIGVVAAYTRDASHAPGSAATPATDRAGGAVATPAQTSGAMTAPVITTSPEPAASATASAVASAPSASVQPSASSAPKPRAPVAPAKTSEPVWKTR